LCKEIYVYSRELYRTIYSWIFIHVNKYRSTPFVMVICYSIRSLYYNLPNQFNECVGWFQFGAIMTSSRIYYLGINLFPFCDWLLSKSRVEDAFDIFLLPVGLSEKLYLFMVLWAMPESAVAQHLISTRYC
jgi:hypothetical protein